VTRITVPSVLYEPLSNLVPSQPTPDQAARPALGGIRDGTIVHACPPRSKWRFDQPGWADLNGRPSGHSRSRWSSRVDATRPQARITQPETPSGGSMLCVSTGARRRGTNTRAGEVGNPMGGGETTDHDGRIQRTSTVNHGHQRKVVSARLPWTPELGVKGSRVQAGEAWDSLSLWKNAIQAAFRR
jgi:hypothetical protein